MIIDNWSIGNLYYQMGFSNIKESVVDYKYIIGDRRVHKQNFFEKLFYI